MAQKQKVKEKLKQKPISSEETVWAKVHEGSSGGKCETMGDRICEKGRF